MSRRATPPLASLLAVPRAVHILRFFALAACPAIAGCFGPGPEEGGFDSPDPAGRLYAVEKAAETNDRAAIPDLIDSLSSDDPAVRMFSILTLERLTGQTLGYDHAASPGQRREAVLRWRNWLADQASEQGAAGTTGTPTSPTPSPAPSSTPSKGR